MTTSQPHSAAIRSNFKCFLQRSLPLSRMACASAPSFITVSAFCHRARTWLAKSKFRRFTASLVGVPSYLVLADCIESSVSRTELSCSCCCTIRSIFSAACRRKSACCSRMVVMMHWHKSRGSTPSGTLD